MTLSDNEDGTLNKVIKLDDATVTEAEVVAEFTNKQLGKITVNKTWAGVTDASDLDALKAGFTLTVTGIDAGGSDVNTKTSPSLICPRPSVTCRWMRPI